MRIAPALLERIVEHARREHPNECCGMIAIRDDRAVAVHEARNVAASPLRFEVDGLEVHRTIEAIEAGGAQLGAIYHSHTRSEPYPSQTDVNFAAGWPGVEWLIVGLGRDTHAPGGAGTGGDGPTVRSFRIEDGRVSEVEVSGDGG